MFKFDITSAYHHIEIVTCHQTFLGFSWPVNGEQKVLCFYCARFWLITGPICVYKLLKDSGEIYSRERCSFCTLS